MPTMSHAATPCLQEISDPDFTDPATASGMTSSAESAPRKSIEESTMKDDANTQTLRRQGSHEYIVRSSLREVGFVANSVRLGTIHNEVGRAA